MNRSPFAAGRIPRMRGTTVIFYYDDLREIVDWYETVLGFTKVADYHEVAIFQVGPAAFLALVDGEAGSQRPIAGTNKGAILSIETEDVEIWHARLSALGIPGAGKPLEKGCNARTIEFRIHDPAGYTIEFFEWVDPPEAWPRPPSE